MRYSWSHPASTIHEVEFKLIGQQTEALIYAPEGTEQGAFAAIGEALRRAGLPAVIPDVMDGRHVLRVEKANKTAVLHTLEYSGMVMGAPTIESDKKPHESFAQKFKKNTVKSAGYAYLLGDSLTILAGLVRMRGLQGDARKGGMAELATGSLWFAPNVLLVAAGKKNPEVETGVLMRKVKAYLDKQGVEIPSEDELTLDHLARKDGPLARIVEFFYEHPTEINNAVEASGGLTMIQGGWEQKLGLPDKSHPNPFKMAAGVALSAGMGSSVVLKEQDGDKSNDKDQGPIARFFSKPLRVAGGGAFINNILNVIGALFWEGPKVKKFLNEQYQPEHDRLSGLMAAAEDWREKAKMEANLDKLKIQRIKASNYGTAAKFNLATAVTFMLANGMYTMASKDTAVDIKAMGGLDQVYAVTAHVISAQPKEHQQELINRMAGFFSTQADIKDNATDIARNLRNRVQGISQSPWAHRVQASQEAGAQPSL